MKNMTTLITAAAAAMILAGCGSDGGYKEDLANAPKEYPTVPFDAPAIDQGTIAAYVNAINAVRAQGADCGSYGHKPPVPPVRWNSNLYHSAYEHANDLAMSGTFSHMGSGTDSDWTAQVLDLNRGSTLDERIGVNGEKLNGKIRGENVAGGVHSVGEAIQSWLNSDGHCALMLTADFKEMGIGSVGDIWVLNMISNIE